MTRINRLFALPLLLLLGFPSVPAGAADDQPDKATLQAELRKMRKDTLDQLYQESPKARKEVRAAAGYGVFSISGAQVLFVGGSGGRGIVRDNLTGKDTFMKVGGVSAGLGVGFKEARLVLIFSNRTVLKDFLDKGWTFGGETAAVAKADDRGGSTGELESPQGIKVYQLTQSGLMAKGTVEGTKYWKDEGLN